MSDPSLKSALEAVERMKPEHEVRSLLESVKTETVDEAIQAARDRAAAFDAATSPISRSVDRAEKAVSASGPADLVRDVTAARLRYTAARYDVEARLNQAIANLYELQVRQSNMAAERHHRRSEREHHRESAEARQQRIDARAAFRRLGFEHPGVVLFIGRIPVGINRRGPVVVLDVVVVVVDPVGPASGVGRGGPGRPAALG